MIGSGLKKFAKESNMQIASGVAYGAMQGYSVTLQEGSGYKQMVIATRFANMEQQRAFEQKVSEVNITSQYRVQQFAVAPDYINVVFGDTMGTMKKIRAFAQWIFPLLRQCGASTADFCNECGAPIQNNGVWMLRDGMVAVHVHDVCSKKIQDQIYGENMERREEAEGSYGFGIVGAVIGSLIGSLVWALVLMAGFVAGIVGLLIGFLANTGYNLMKGKQGQAKIAILVIAIILGVLVGTVGGTCLQVVSVMNEEGVPMEYFGELMQYVLEDSGAQAEIMGNAVIGLLFAGLGVFGLLKQERKKIVGETIKILK